MMHAISFALSAFLVIKGQAEAASVRGSRLLEDFPAFDNTLEALKKTDSETGYLVEKYHPIFDFDGDGCFPSCAISRGGKLNDGYEGSWRSLEKKMPRL